MVRSPCHDEVEAHHDIIGHPADGPFVVAAIKADVNDLVTFNRRHFMDDPEVTAQAGTPIGTPGEVLAWVREQVDQEMR